MLHHANECMGIEYCVQHEGEKRWLRMDVYMISKEDGMVRDGVLTFRNVTEERTKELEIRAEEERAKKALIEAYEAAQQGSLAKTDFLSKMSHDIRTPMNAILGMTTLAERNLQNPERLQDCLAKIRLSSEHLLQLINEVLDMSKIESGNLELQDKPFHIPTLVRQTVEMMRQESQEKQQQFTLTVEAPEHANVRGDRVRVQRILLNLISNAIKYTPEGGHIEVQLRELLTSAGNVGCYQFVVRDDGIGMSEEYVQHIFQPFERAEDSRVSKIQGTGLGMPITLNLVQMMNGTIDIASVLNEGTCITVTIYLEIADKGEVQPEPEEVVQKVNQTEYTRRILLVEDNDLNREIAKELLEMEAFLVETAENGQEGVTAFSSKPAYYYDVILMDIQMPVMNGYDAAKAIRQLERKDAAEIPIIALTANAFADDIYAAKQAGMNTHLAKPLDLKQLCKVLNQWLPYDVGELS